MNRWIIVSIQIIWLASCADKVHLHRVKIFLNADSQKQKGRFLATDYHSYFLERKGVGESKREVLQSFLTWDAPLHPAVTILSYSRTGSEWKINFLEQNDFSKLIGFPGWKASYSVTFDAKKMVRETIYIPDDSNPNYKKWLQPALDWLSQHRRAGLDSVYQDNKLVKTSVAAHKWVELLRAWKTENAKTK